MNRFILHKNQFSTFVKLSVFLICLSASPLMAQWGAGMAEQQKKQMQTQFLMQQLMQLNFNSELRKDLELVDEQLKEATQLAKDYQKEMMEFQMENSEVQMELQQLYKDGNHAEAHELSKEYRKKYTEFTESFIDRAKETFLPHQMERLEQIATQRRVKTMNQFQDQFGVTSALSDEIGMSAEEKKRLIDVIKEARKEYYEAVAAAKKKANETIMASLTEEQKEKLKDILGESYDQGAMMRKSREEMSKRQQEMMKKQQKKD